MIKTSDKCDFLGHFGTTTRLPWRTETKNGSNTGATASQVYGLLPRVPGVSECLGVLKMYLTYLTLRVSFSFNHFLYSFVFFLGLLCFFHCSFATTFVGHRWWLVGARVLIGCFLF